MKLSPSASMNATYGPLEDDDVGNIVTLAADGQLEVRTLSGQQWKYLPSDLVLVMSAADTDQPPHDSPPAQTDRRLSDGAVSSDGAPDTPPPIPTESPDLSDAEGEGLVAHPAGRSLPMPPPAESTPVAAAAKVHVEGSSPTYTPIAALPIVGKVGGSGGSADISFRDLPLDIAFDSADMSSAGLEDVAGESEAPGAVATSMMGGGISGKRAQQVALLRQFDIVSAPKMVDILHNEGLDDIEDLFGVEGEDWDLINLLLESSGISDADRQAFHAIRPDAVVSRAGKHLSLICYSPSAYMSVQLHPVRLPVTFVVFLFFALFG